MPGSATFTPYALPLDAAAYPIGVFRFDRTKPAGERVGPALANVRCVQVQSFDGPHPQGARFEYVFGDPLLGDAYPDSFGDVWPLGATGPYVVQNDDELVVIAFAPNGDRRVLFHGFAQVPQVDVTRAGQAATFAAAGVAVRLWDDPIAGATYRAADSPQSTAKADRLVIDRRVHFNPAVTLNGTAAIQPNCTPDGHDVNEGTRTAFPIFLDPAVYRANDPRTKWTLGKLARYLLMTCNQFEDYVKNPDMRLLESLLEVAAPKKGRFFIPDDPSTYDVNPIDVRDFDATNLAWPDAIHQQIARHGFSFRFRLQTDEDGEPVHTIEFYRKDAKDVLEPLTLSLQESGAVLDPGKTNVGELRLARDQSHVANRFAIETRPILYEVSVVLAPDFTPTTGDAAVAVIDQFKRSKQAQAAPDIRNRYRRYVADELGDGHWDFATAATVATALVWTPVFGTSPKADDGSPGPATYIERARPGRDTLVSLDATGRPYRSFLSYSFDYAGTTAGKAPAVWDGTGTWLPIAGGWELLKDRLGIYVNVENPEGWAVADKVKLSGITSLSDPTSGPTSPTPRFFLRLTTVIEGDTMLDAVAEKRKASPSKFAVTRRIDAADHFQKQVIAANTPFNLTARAITDGTPDPTTHRSRVRDDTAIALAHAEAYRSAHEFPPLAGSVVIPSLVQAYQVSNRVRIVKGRDVSLQTNVGTDQGEAPEYPWIESVTWSFAGDMQTTTLQLSDRRAEPRRA